VSHNHQQLSRVLGPWQAASVVVGMVVGAGIFRSAPAAAQALGGANAVLLAWALGGVVALAGALCYAELSSAYPDPGGDYRFLREAFGGDIAFLFAWSRFAVIFTGSAAMLAFVAADYLAQLIPLDARGRALIAGGLVVAMTILNLRGLRTSARTQVALVTFDVVAMLALGAAAFWLLAHSAVPVAPVVAPVTGVGGFGTALVFVMLAYGGFNDSATLSAEVRRPRDMTLALVGGMGVVTALYLLTNWAYLTGLGFEGLAASDAPAAALMHRAFGTVGESLMVVAVAIASIAIINALIIVGGRTLYATAEDEPGLARLAQWDSARGVPRLAVLAQGSAALLLVCWGAFQGRGFAAMVDYMSPIYWLFLSMSGFALIRLRRRDGAASRGYRVPLYPLMPLLFSAGSLWVLQSSIFYVGWRGCALSFGMLFLGLVVRRVLRARAARASATAG
jgi:amino acid transporter